MSAAVIAVLMKMLFILFGGAVAAIGGYVGTRLKNEAMMHDLEDLKTQNREIRQATKEIEAKIDDQVWNRQRQWEIKRDMMFTAVKSLNEVDNKLQSLNIFWQHKLEGQMESTSEEVGASLQNSYVNGWSDAIKSFEEVEALTQITCSTETMKAFAQLGGLLKSTAGKIVNGDTDAYNSSRKERDKLFGLAKLAIRKELGIPASVMPLSSGSSEAQIPGPQALG